MRRGWIAPLLAAVCVSNAAAQTDELLRRAVDSYENLLIEQARDMFLQVVNSPFDVSPQQRVTAFVYLGASYASLNRPDSSLLYFRAAIERNPFIDLDPRRFSDVERQQFAEARRRTFKVGLQPLDSMEFDPRTQSVSITALTTHNGNLQIEVAHTRQATRFPLFQGQSEGLRQLTWAGTLPNGALAPPGTYQLIVRGQSVTNQVVDSTVVLFSLAHRFAALEDTLRALQPNELLTERHPSSIAARDLLVGIGVAAGAMLIPPTMGEGSLRQPTGLSITMASVATVTGVFAYFNRRNHMAIPENIAENQRRRAERTRINAERQQRNAAKIAATRLFIAPATGARP